jgi:hypothetical protein
VAVTAVQFKVDGVNVGASGTTSPNSITWDSTSVADGSHTVAAVAHDAAGNYATSSVTVSTLQGFLPNCSSVFDVTNLLTQSNSFTTSPWAVFGGGGVAAPTITPNSALAPDGTMTASTLALPAVSGIHAQSVLYQRPSALTNYPYVGDIYVKGAVGGETLWIWGTPDGVTFKSTMIVATTSWQRVAASWSRTGAGNWYFQIGVNLDDSAQSSRPAQTVFIADAQIVQDIVEWPYIATVGSTVKQSFTQSCPAPVAFGTFQAY